MFLVNTILWEASDSTLGEYIFTVLFKLHLPSLITLPQVLHHQPHCPSANLTDRNKIVSVCPPASIMKIVKPLPVILPKFAPPPIPMIFFGCWMIGSNQEYRCPSSMLTLPCVNVVLSWQQEALIGINAWCLWMVLGQMIKGIRHLHHVRKLLSGVLLTWLLWMKLSEAYSRNSETS